jgi:hypothetical protein
VRATGYSAYRAYQALKGTHQEPRVRESETIVPGGVPNQDIVAFAKNSGQMMLGKGSNPKRDVYVREDVWERMPHSEKCAIVAPHIGRIPSVNLKYGSAYKMSLDEYRITYQTAGSAAAAGGRGRGGKGRGRKGRAAGGPSAPEAADHAGCGGCLASFLRCCIFQRSGSTGSADRPLLAKENGRATQHND